MLPLVPIPPRSVLHRLQLLAAGSVIVALPTLLVFLLLQRHFIAGLTLGSTKG